jgi:hypothetical protein
LITTGTILLSKRSVRHFTGGEWETVDSQARAVSVKASFRWRDFSESIARPEKRPFMLHYDGHHNRIDRIVRPRETEILEKEIFSEAFFADKTSPWVKLIKMYLIYQNGEACIGCPVTCTEGLVKLLEKYADTPETKQILQALQRGHSGRFCHWRPVSFGNPGWFGCPGECAGSRLCEDGVWRLYGTKFFCSATHADYAVVTAKPIGSEKVALFVGAFLAPRQQRKGNKKRLHH